MSKIPWLYKPLQTSEEECDVFGRISFSHDETERLHMLSKDHKRTITQVVTALLSIAVAESALRAAGKANIEQFQLVADGFANATHLFSSMNFVNMVCFCIPRYIFSPYALYRDLVFQQSTNCSIHSIAHRSSV